MGPRTWDPSTRIEQLECRASKGPPRKWSVAQDTEQREMGVIPRATEQSVVVDRHAHQLWSITPLTAVLGSVLAIKDLAIQVLHDGC